jgi:hypothetical protein
MAQTVTFQDGVSGAGTNQDGWMSDFGAGLNSTSETFEIQVNLVKGALRYKRVITMIEMDEIPDNAIVTSGIFTLYVTSGASGNNVAFQANRSSQTDWVESSGSPTWPFAYPTSISWSSAGGSAASDQVVTLGDLPTSTGPIDYDITSIVRDAVDNRGKVLNFLLLPQVSIAEDVFVFASSKHSTTQYRPKLTVKYVEGGGAAGKARTTTMRSGGRKSMMKRNRRLFRR